MRGRFLAGFQRVLSFKERIFFRRGGRSGDPLLKGEETFAILRAEFEKTREQTRK